MVKTVSYSYKGMNQDVTKSKHSPEFYYSADNIRIINTDSQSSFSVANERGNELRIELPEVEIFRRSNKIVYGDSTLTYRQGAEFPEIEKQINSGLLERVSNGHKIIGHAIGRDDIILFSTSKGFSRAGQMDCIWVVENIFQDDFTLKLIYVRNLGFSTQNPIQAIFNYENERLQKVYWVDGKNQLRFVNIKHSIENGDLENLIDVSGNTLNMVGNFNLSQPKITGFSTGGQHTSGMIQYAYNLYRLNASQTKASPLSELVPLDKGVSGGGALNEIVGSIPIIKIENLDTEFTHIRLYAIKYTSYNELPSVSLIAEEEFSTSTFTYYDDGSEIETLSIAQFLFLGSNPIVPKHIEAKDNQLFSSNIKESAFDVDLDMRAYSHNNAGNGIVWDNVFAQSNGAPNGTPTAFSNGNWNNIGTKNDAVNPNYNVYKYQGDGVTLGGEGIYIKYELKQTPLNDTEASEYRFFKDNEIYRIGIEFYNKLGQKSFVKWIADFRAPEGNLQGMYNTLEVDLKPSFIDWISTNNFESENDIPVGYAIVRANRDPVDRTIIASGVLTHMMARTTRDASNSEYWNGGEGTVQYENRKLESDSLTKFPIPITRGFKAGGVDSLAPLFTTQHLRKMNYSGEGANTEIWESPATSGKLQQSWQYSKMFQMQTPEALFNTGLSLTPNCNLKIKGICKNTTNNVWFKRVDKIIGNDSASAKGIGVTNLYNVDSTFTFDAGFFGPSNNINVMKQIRMDRQYMTFSAAPQPALRPIYGTPELTFKGQSGVSYNNNGKLNYSNSMSQFLTDCGDRNNNGCDEDRRAIVTMASWGNNCITLVEGNEDDIENKKTLEWFKGASQVTEDDGLLYGEITISNANIYLGNIYGGNSYEAKTRNTYVKIGDYQTVDQLTTTILSPGDTYVGTFHFARIVRNETDSRDDQTLLYTETIKYKTETTVDLKNRNDKSLYEWDAEFQPTDEDFHQYNRVYSQMPSLVQSTPEFFNFRRIKEFDTRIQASSTKIPGEDIDSWTDVLTNEFLDLDGKYGPINGLAIANDNMFAVQDQAVAVLNINPNVQVQSADGISLELGSGNVLYSSKYISTQSGSINKWAISGGDNGLYYFDALNKSFVRIREGIENLSDSRGFNAYFENNIVFNEIEHDNPILRRGIVVAHHPMNHEVYLTVLSNSKDFTMAYSEITDSFTSFYSYTPSMYIIKGNKMLTMGLSKNELWEHFKGDWNSFYGTLYDSRVEFLVNPPEADCVFNNIAYKSEVYDNEGIDKPTETLTHIRGYNEYQLSNETALTLHSNIQRKFRMWRANIPREANTINRLRGNWLFLNLIYRNENNRKLILHDMHIGYNGY